MASSTAISSELSLLFQSLRQFNCGVKSVQCPVIDCPQLRLIPRGIEEKNTFFNEKYFESH